MKRKRITRQEWNPRAEDAWMHIEEEEIYIVGNDNYSGDNISWYPETGIIWAYVNREQKREPAPLSWEFE